MEKINKLPSPLREEAIELTKKMVPEFALEDTTDKYNYRV
jgi:hypothetical protein